MADQQPSQYKFTIGDATSFGWETMKKYMGFLIPVVIIIAVVNAAESGLSSLTRYMPVGVAAFYGTLFTLISITVSVFIYMAYIKIGLRYCDGEEADYNDLSILAYKGLDEFLGNDKLQAHLAVQAANIECCEFGGEAVDFETEGFISMKSAVTTLFTTIREQLRELKKK